LKAFRNEGVSVIQKPIETVTMKGLDVSLLASGYGTEVIHHRLQSGFRWGISPQEDWHALEKIYIIKGELLLKRLNQEETLVSGDFYSECPVKEEVLCIAKEETEFLYITSQPVFHFYSKITKQLMDLAVEVEQKDGYTHDHCERIMKMSMRLGEVLKLPQQDLPVLNYASFLHDVGKMNVPDHILNKPGKLTDEEWVIMKKHAEFGRDILLNTDLPILKKAAAIVVQHHERYDGKGYPNGLKGEQIDLKAGIITVVDAFDAMTKDRVYRTAMPFDEAVQEIIRCSETMFHPKVVDAFLSIKDEFI
jgi:HD-GYP domain-containing protein (c-di-GMP phosphodiesterase class II)